MRSLEWIRLYQKHVLYRDVIGGGGAGDIRHIPPDFVKGQCTVEIGILDSRKIRNKKLTHIIKFPPTPRKTGNESPDYIT